MKRTRVLIIDDNKSLVDMIKEYFSEHADIKISLEAYDGAEGLRLIDKKREEYDICRNNKEGTALRYKR